MIEVEVKAKIDNFEHIVKELNNRGAIKQNKIYQEDIYFKSPIVDFVKTDECLRIRTTMENDSKKYYITYKGPKFDLKGQTRKEIETAVESSEKCCELFESLGFTKAFTVKKNRQYYKYENFLICLDDVEGLEPYMEIEIDLENKIGYKEAQDKIFELYKKLGIKEGFERKSYLELLGEAMNK